MIRQIALKYLAIIDVSSANVDISWPSVNVYNIVFKIFIIPTGRLKKGSHTTLLRSYSHGMQSNTQFFPPILLIFHKFLKYRHIKRV